MAKSGNGCARANCVYVSRTVPTQEQKRQQIVTQTWTQAKTLRQMMIPANCITGWWSLRQVGITNIIFNNIAIIAKLLSLFAII